MEGTNSDYPNENLAGNWVEIAGRACVPNFARKNRYPQNFLTNRKHLHKLVTNFIRKELKTVYTLNT